MLEFLSLSNYAALKGGYHLYSLVINIGTFFLSGGTMVSPSYNNLEYNSEACLRNGDIEALYEITRRFD